MIRYNLLILAFFIALSPGVSAQVRPRIDGLGDNEQYMTLLEREASLHRAEDSITTLIDDVRRAFSPESPNRDSLGRRILGLEEQLFDVRNDIGRVINSISAIEQGFLASSLGRGNGAVTARAGTLGELLRENLPGEDFEQFQAARAVESRLKALAGEYWTNYDKIRELTAVYDTVGEAEADSVRFAIDSLGALDREIEGRFAAVWEPAYDEESYAYMYMLDYLRENAALAEMERKLAAANENVAALSGKVESEVLAGYAIRKELLLACEKKLAELCGDKVAVEAVDAKIAENSRLAYDKPPLEFRQRNFIEYDSIKFSSPSIYNASNPIPRERVRDFGTVYKVDVGVFARQQAVSVFRGVSPVTYDILDDGRYIYYVGAYRTASEVAGAVEELKRRGFRRTEVVVWNDGRREEIDLSQGDGAGFYRVEVPGMGETLDPAVRTAMEEAAPGKEITRIVGEDGKYVYIVGSFSGYDLAEKVVAAVREAAGVGASIIPAE